jgi:hypothetical protein
MEKELKSDDWIERCFSLVFLNVQEALETRVECEEMQHNVFEADMKQINKRFKQWNILKSIVQGED